MNDPWNVKSVRQSRQYVSCMKINGVPLLPPVTFVEATYFECRLLESIQEYTKIILLKVKKIFVKLYKECREEMQYYKLLAKEVEKRISILQPYVYDTNSTCSELDNTEAPEIPECEQSYEVCEEEIRVISPRCIETSATASPKHVNSNKTSNTIVENMGSPTSTLENYPQFFLDLNLNVNTTDRYVSNTVQKVCSPPPHKEVPERDYNCIRRVSHEVITEKKISEVKNKNNVRKEKFADEDFIYTANKEPMSDPLSGIPLPHNGPSSLSSKSFTGSLNNLHSEGIKDCQINSGKLMRQRSYTLLKPSPHLLAHLEVHSQNTGVEMTSISMSESLSNINTPSKKRRSWDLESAKVKWSSMAMELNQKNVVKVISRTSVSKRIVTPAPIRNTPPKRNSIVTKPSTKSESSSRAKKTLSLVRHNVNDCASRTEPPSPTVNNKTRVFSKHTPIPVSESEDPATKVRELYDKIQKQQMVQMASLVEKQKREQLLLQQLFEEQNNLFYKQLKTICPTSPIEVKEAWGDQHCEVDRGPVSLSQVINYKSPDQSPYSSPVTSTLTNTNNYISHCDNVLKKSRDITGSLKKQQVKSYSQNGTKIQSPKMQPDGSRTRTHSPVQRNSPVSRRLNYDSSASTDRDYDQMLTDRTNDTLADLNVTFPSDHSDDVNTSIVKNCVDVSQRCAKEMNMIHGHSSCTYSTAHSRSTDNAIKKMERTITNTMNNVVACSSKPAVFKNPPTAKQREAATKIVAHVKGYLVRRLMRTDRVQGIVQTIKDALLCALQLHQDREGIRGADVDLHRRLIQQITAACYSLHDTFVASTPAERCAMIAADRARRRRSLISGTSNKSFRQTDIMSQSHSGSFPARIKRQPPSLMMTQSNYETFSGDKSSPVSRRYMASPRRRPWR